MAQANVNTEVEEELKDAEKWSKLKTYLQEKHMSEQVEFYEKYKLFISEKDEGERTKIANDIIDQCLTQPSGKGDSGKYCLPDQPACWPMIKRMKSRLNKAQDAKNDDTKIVYPQDFFNNVYDTMVSRIASLWDDYKK